MLITGSTEHFERVFEFCKKYPSTGHGLKTNDPKVREVKKALQILGDTLLQLLDQPDLELRIPKGQGAFPRIPWVVLCPNSSLAPKSGVYLCLTFSADGDGLVGGIITATAEKKKWGTQLTKLPKQSGGNIDGHKQNTRYSDAYFNPRVFEREQFELQELVDHLKASLQDIVKLTPIESRPSL